MRITLSGVGTAAINYKHQLRVTFEFDSSILKNYYGSQHPVTPKQFLMEKCFHIKTVILYHRYELG